MLSILASYAQEESLSNRENMKWRIHSNFQNGLAWNPTLLGYRYDGGTYHIEPTEAETVRQIFDSYLDGMGATASGYFPQCCIRSPHISIFRHLHSATKTFRVQRQYILLCDTPAIFGRKSRDEKDKWWYGKLLEKFLR